MRRTLVTLAALGLALAAPSGLAHAAGHPATLPGEVFYATCVSGGGSAVWDAAQGYYVCTGGVYSGERIVGKVPILN